MGGSDTFYIGKYGWWVGVIHFMMSPNLHWNIAIQTLRKQAEKAVLGIKLLGNKCGALPKNIAFQMFDSKVLPILCYGSEIWGTKMRSEIEIVHNQFCKYVLGLGPRSVNVVALAECGRRPFSLVGNWTPRAPPGQSNETYFFRLIIMSRKQISMLTG